ncbi:hypothetical protein RSAG8_09430, partial [Rhizoctonia solani AG-8 WAC10335]
MGGTSPFLRVKGRTLRVKGEITLPCLLSRLCWVCCFQFGCGGLRYGHRYGIIAICPPRKLTFGSVIPKISSWARNMRRPLSSASWASLVFPPTSWRKKFTRLGI